MLRVGLQNVVGLLCGGSGGHLGDRRRETCCALRQTRAQHNTLPQHKFRGKTAGNGATSFFKKTVFKDNTRETWSCNMVAQELGDVSRKKPLTGPWPYFLFC